MLELLCEGLSNMAIGERLQIAHGTVKTHVASVLRALSASSRLHAVRIAREAGFDPIKYRIRRP